MRGGLFGLMRRLYYGQTNFDFVRRRRVWFAVSALVILAGIVSLGLRGLNFDIEFVGGTSWQVPANGATVTEARAAVAPYGLSGATITMLGTGKSQTLDIEAKLNSNKNVTSSKSVNEVSRALAEVTHHPSVAAVTVQEVGPTWGSQITHKAIVALIVFFILIAAYISLFFEWKMAVAAIIAVLHDILVTVGIYSLSSFLVTPDTVVAFLTVLGYSLYDTIVVFDRIRDNTKGIGATGKLTFTDVVNLSMNQTIARSVNTSLVAILPILSVLVLGADVLGATTLEYFGLALLIGLTSGAYSSIFIASPLVAVFKEREPRYRQIRKRLEARGEGLALLTPSAVATGDYAETRGEGGETRSSAGRRGGRRRQTEAVASEPLRPSAARTGSRQAVAVEEDEGAAAGAWRPGGEDAEEEAAALPERPRAGAKAGTPPLPKNGSTGRPEAGGAIEGRPRKAKSSARSSGGQRSGAKSRKRRRR